MKLNAFSKTYEGRRVLSVPALELGAGKICAVVGANGSGKSTFARILAGVLAPDGGGEPVEKTLRVGYMPQHSFAFRMSTRRNILLSEKDEARAQTLMEALGLLPLAGQSARRLSGGEMQRMALARVMMRRWDVLVLDEPTASMDMEATIRAEEQLLRYRREYGCTMVLVTHSLQQARRLADEALFFCAGELVEHGDADTVLHRPREAQTRAFLDFYGT